MQGSFVISAVIVGSCLQDNEAVGYISFDSENSEKNSLGESKRVPLGGTSAPEFELLRCGHHLVIKEIF